MEDDAAIVALSALAQEHRLKVFRLLVKSAQEGMRAGEIAEAIGVVPSSLSHHLSLLTQSGLVRTWRISRNIYYAINLDGVRALLSFLTEDCCAGHPEICGDLHKVLEHCDQP